MKVITKDQLKIGMIFDQHVFIDPYHILLEAHTELEEKDLERLEKWSIPEVYTFGLDAKEATRDAKAEMQKDDPSENLDIPVTEIILPPKEVSVETIKEQYERFRDRRHIFQKSISKTISVLEQCYRSMLAKKPLEIDILKSCANELTNELLMTPMHILLLNYKVSNSNHTMHHLIHTACYGIILAETLNIKLTNISNICLGMLMMDVGMLAIPTHVRDKVAPLEDSDVKILRTHTILGFRLLENMKELRHIIGNITLQHHEAFDGSGYPRGLKGSEIDPIATIATTCDSYTAMIEKRPFRDAHLPAVALRNMLAPQNINRYNPKVIRAFARRLSIFPLGSFVKLSNNAIAMVVASHLEMPKRPIVRLMRNSSGDSTAMLQFIDLGREDNLSILQAIPPKGTGIEPIKEI